MNKKIWIVLSAVALVLVVAVMAGIFFFNRPQPQEGAKTITITVVHKDDSKKEFTYQTDETYLGPLLVAKGLIPEGNIVNGMFDTVDGETAVWAEDEGWWGIYKGDEMTTVGINEQVIADGDSFTLEYINGFAS
ncbi:MAG: DUF4430 domain-containing protein [Ruminococcaceae bacterium]|nr:DUF4430 domain-containing protein [Oscillospiraceae bacterium]